MIDSQPLDTFNSVQHKKILLTGGSGALGQWLRKLLPCAAPSSNELDITNAAACEKWIKQISPDIILHTAAYTDVSKADTDRKTCWNVNVFGTENMARASQGRKFVYISTAYVFDGERGNYNEDDMPNPVNYYSLTKLLGEIIVRQYEPHLIIRTMFKKDGPWPYDKAFVDQWSTAEFASVMAPKIVKAALLDTLTGILHISGEKRTIYELAKMATPDVGKNSIDDVPVKLPRDVSLDNSLWNNLKTGMAAKKS